jgi:DNA-binding PadR family transcriptional regulator
MTYKHKKETQTKLTKSLLDVIVLQYLDQTSMHGYQIITKIRKDFGVYVGTSTIYPLLELLEKKGYLNSSWNMNTERPRKVYTITKDGKKVLSFTESNLSRICKTMVTDTEIRIQAT